jgi:NlpC/P60 family putative phage cell wall peptidase
VTSIDKADSQRLTVVAAARSWIGTPYHHAADIKHVGVDCAMILVRVYCDLGLVEPFDPRPYTKDWFVHRNEERYMGFLLARAHEVATPQPGDVVLFKLGRCFAHGGIVSQADPLKLIHAYSPARSVIEEEIMRNAALAESPHKFFSYWA